MYGTFVHSHLPVLFLCCLEFALSYVALPCLAAVRLNLEFEAKLYKDYRVSSLVFPCKDMYTSGDGQILTRQGPFRLLLFLVCRVTVKF